MRILMIEDDAALRRAVAARLSAEGWTVTECGDSEEGAWYLEDDAWDVVLLDRMLPGTEGLARLRHARAAGLAAPVLLLTALDAVDDRVDGLDAGADDYLVKPFDLRELCARIRALARRPAPAERDGAVTCGDLSLAVHTHTLHGPRGEVELSVKEAELLLLFLRNPGQTLTRETLMARVWGPDAVEESSLDTYIHFVRRRIAAAGTRCVIENRRGVGYRLVEGTP